ncbi:MAG: tRNA (guanosine(37)-N1)-methyltransferase TrmD [bacterium]|nr:tRNA (guanosine(37)-N1)-methyltransferase TrmD [Acidimicrobiia bacterium]MCY4650445.1 tRNA (guanosine(37)-N1)-methyltransferase TrmD [bacterium]
MKISIVTIFPRYFPQALGLGVLGRALDAGLLDVDVIDLREYASGTHRAVDDAPFGGGPGMVMTPEPLARALDPLEGTHRVLFAPVGRRLGQSMLDRWSKLDHLTLVCGRYEGVDERIAEHFIDEEVSVGDFVLAGGEVAALLVLEGVVRLLPDAVGNPCSVVFESFREGLLEEPVYTRPATFRGWSVPEVLLSGDHQRIADWRHAKRQERTRNRRPDLWDGN